MTHFTNNITIQGPLLTVMVGISVPRQQAMAAAGLTLPLPVRAQMLIDTGASHTSLCKTIIQALSLTPTGSIPILTPSTGTIPHQVSTYDVLLAVMGVTPQDVHLLPTWSVSECDFTGQGISGLIGRDILARGRLTYSGPDATYFLSF